MAKMQTSEESNAKQLERAKEQGEALQKALQAMDEESETGVHVKRAGDYEIGIACEEAEGMWHPTGSGDLEWRDPTDENCHVEVCVRDAADGRFLPGLEVSVTLLGPDGEEIGTHEQPFLWHPWLYHYGRNWKIPGAGEYTIRVHVEPPAYARHDHENGCRYREPANVQFDGIELEPGQKKVES